ncbi:hypothetical protein PYW07_002237 [Mythimna separata]|uniref:F-ATPase delta subunit n=1 Tax=Mythimna separata TaxID=271217 RepID=A0AAD8DSW7_MYTSE|nr:hypothetical protein PYW07_002237 [Mythimna separata]
MKIRLASSKTKPETRIGFEFTNLTINCLSPIFQKARKISSVKYNKLPFQNPKMALAFRNGLRTVARRLQVRNYADAPKGDEMALTFAAGNKVFYDKVVVKQIDVPSMSGAFGILPKHVPTLAVLRPGVVSVIENDGKLNKIFVSSGTVTVNDDSSVQVLAEEAHPLENLDRAAAQESLSKAQSEYSSASNDKAKAEAAIAVEVAEEILKAASG